jgi:hypothetical protein
MIYAEDTIVKQAKIGLTPNTAEQIIMHSLLRKDASGDVKPGLWNIKLYLNNSGSDIDDYSVVIKFLILPTNTNESLINTTALDLIYKKFWKHDGLCLTRQNTKLNGVLPDCKDSKTHWSSLYPDPKSSVTGLNYANANAEKMLNRNTRILTN